MAPRSIWNGTISFGAVHVPIKLYSATESKSVSFTDVHLDDGAQIEHRRFCTKEDKEVPYEEVIRGFETSSGAYVVLEKEEADAAAGDRTRIVEVEHFVPLADIDPVFFDKAYYAGPRDDSSDAYKLLAAALEKTGRAAIGRFTLRNREYLVAIRPYADVLAIHTLRFADEIGGAELPDPPKGVRKPAEKEIEMAQRLVETLHERFKPERYEDTYREAILDVVRRKASGKPIEMAEDEEPSGGGDDLVAALEASLSGGR
jgi:DNA end-binding protein Ku